MMKRAPMVVMMGLLGAVGTAGAAGYFSQPFATFTDSAGIAAPCPLLGPASAFVNHQGIVNLTYTCKDGMVIIRTDTPTPTNPNIHMHLDAPTDTVYQGTVAMGGGWAFECGHAISQYKLKIGGTVTDYIATWGGKREDVAAAFPNLCFAESERSGVNFTVDMSAFAPGQYPMSLLAMDDQGQWAESNTLTVAVR